MKNKVKMSRGDVRLGNFIFHPEKESVKVYDINGLVSHRISKATAKGTLLSLAVEKPKDNEDWLKNYAAVIFNVLSCVPDVEFFTALNDAAIACVNRHADLYGIKKDISKEEDDAIVKDQKELHDAMETLREGAEC